ncbi:MAG TPA: NAD(P)/FAD-dependent oxidoreductase [Xanthobacteraceae bacterium]|nr:NAD(P)/FAD-dependent oxidoreductase [Xanthobacteraceae bacterium]
MSSINRRSFLASAAALAAAPALGAVPASGDVDVAIIGAGAAGIAAARKVAEFNRSFALLEAGDHVGGRCITDTRSFGAPFDRGAHWIRQMDVNPVASLNKTSGFDVYPAPLGQKIRIGQRYAREGELEAFLANLVRANRAIADAAGRKTDVACAQALPPDLGAWAQTIGFVLGPYGTAKELSAISAADFAKADRDHSGFCRQGYGTLLARTARSLPVQLSTPALAIDWQRGLTITTPRGTINPRTIIVTASVDVLTSGSLKFIPPPKRVLDAAAKLKLGSYERIALDLPGNPLGLASDDAVFEQAQDPKTAAMLANVSGSPLCFVDIGGNLARDLAMQGEKEMVAFALEWLAKIYGTDLKKSVREARATRWLKDPLVLGAWSSAAPGAQSARRTLMEPVDDRIWFAGEAAHETLWGTVQGAWQSGERAAEGALRRIGAFKKPAASAAPAAKAAPSHRR